MKNIKILIILTLSILSASISWGGSILPSKHNLSRSGPGPYKVDFMGTEMVCIFCHTPHSPMQNSPLWNRNPSAVAGSSYRLYSSSASMKNISHRSGFTSDSLSVFCLNCHDGSPLGGSALMNKPIDGNSNVVGPNGESGIANTRNAFFATNLSNHHPVNFNVTVSGMENGLGDIVATSAGTVMKTDVVPSGLPLFRSARGNNTLECASCHFVHDPANPSFLRIPMEGNMLCLACHIY